MSDAVRHGAPASVRDPVSYAFAHGGKDGTPFPVDRPRTTRPWSHCAGRSVKAKAGRTEKVDALKRLARLGPDT
ncbi:MAG: DUF763 domain-containing protein [Actinomycetota bacterium]